MSRTSEGSFEGHWGNIWACHCVRLLVCMDGVVTIIDPCMFFNTFVHAIHGFLFLTVNKPTTIPGMWLQMK